MTNDTRKCLKADGKWKAHIACLSDEQLRFDALRHCWAIERLVARFGSSAVTTFTCHRINGKGMRDAITLAVAQSIALGKDYPGGMFCVPFRRRCSIAA